MTGLVPVSHSTAPEHSPTPGCEQCSTGKGREEGERRKEGGTEERKRRRLVRRERKGEREGGR